MRRLISVVLACCVLAIVGCASMLSNIQTGPSCLSGLNVLVLSGNNQYAALAQGALYQALSQGGAILVGATQQGYGQESNVSRHLDVRVIAGQRTGVVQGQSGGVVSYIDLDFQLIVPNPPQVIGSIREEVTRVNLLGSGSESWIYGFNFPSSDPSPAFARASIAAINKFCATSQAGLLSGLQLTTMPIHAGGVVLQQSAPPQQYYGQASRCLAQLRGYRVLAQGDASSLAPYEGERFSSALNDLFRRDQRRRESTYDFFLFVRVRGDYLEVEVRDANQRSLFRVEREIRRSQSCQHDRVCNLAQTFQAMLDIPCN